MKRTIWLATLPLLLLALLAACGDDDDADSSTVTPTAEGYTAEEQAAVDYVNGLFETFNSGDVAGFLDELEEPALRALLEDEETPIDALKADAEEFLSGETLEVVRFEEVTATANSASVTLVTTLGDTLDKERYELSGSGTDFQMSGYEDLPEDIPEGVTPLAVSGIDFGYEFDGETAAEGVQVIEFTNDGEQFHELALVRLASDSPELDTVVDDFVTSSAEEGYPDAEYLDHFVTAVFAGPGETTMMTLREELPAARYVMICFIPDQTQGDEGPPHAELGMAAEFTVE